MKRNWMKKAMAFAISLILVLGLVPIMAFADGTTENSETTVTFTAIEGTAGASDAEGCEKLLDGKYTENNFSKWCVLDTEAYIIFEASEACIVNGYSFVTGDDNYTETGRNPRSWTLYGCNSSEAGEDSADWVAVHSVTDDQVMMDFNYTKYDFIVSGQTTKYKYFMLKITAIRSGSIMQLAEIILDATTCVHTPTGARTVVPPTCTEKGYTLLHCSVCDCDYKADFKEAKGHSLEEGNLCTACGFVICGDFLLKGGVLGTDYTYENNFLTIKANTPVTIIGTSNIDSIAIANGISANVTLAGVHIDVSSTYRAAFKIDEGSVGNVTVTLADGTENSLKSGKYRAGLQKNGSYISKTQGKLTIQGGELGTGSLKAMGGSDGAGIGGDACSIGSNITILGGTVEATGGVNGAGIGGGNVRYGSNITILGGTVYATGGGNGAGIGGGYSGRGSDITILGGTVYATGGHSAAGIGGGQNGNGANINIRGGVVTAVGSEWGAGIGGGYDGSGSNIAIDSGTVTALGGNYAAGIGGGYNGTGDNITINGGTVVATGGQHAAGIGGGGYAAGNDGNQNTDGSHITINGGTVKATGGMYGAGIGSGRFGTGSHITVTGGTVTATGGFYAAGIGGGYDGTGSNVIINGGSVKAVGGESANHIGGGFAYDVVISALIPTDGSEAANPVYLLELTVDGSNTVVINDRYYPIAHGEENKLYVYLPAKSADDPNVVFLGSNESAVGYYYDEANETWNTSNVGYTVIYKADGKVVSAQLVQSGEDATVPEIPEKEGYTQTAPVWDNDGTNITANTVINAIYTANTYTVTYKAGETVVGKIEVEHGSNATAPAVPEKTGYTGVWNHNGENITTDTVIEAVYTIKSFTVDNITYTVLTDEEGNYTVEVSGNTLTTETSVTLPSTVSYNGITYTVTAIADASWYKKSAFYSCTSLTTVTLPDTITSIGTSAFYDCSGLTSITIPYGVTSIGYSAFHGCSGLTRITLPDSLLLIDDAAFYGCSALTSISLPDSLITLDQYAFYKCSGLTSITIPNGVTKIDTNTFQGCSGLTSIEIPDSVAWIGGFAFYGCSGLTSITIPDNVASIGNSAFYGCSGLTSIKIPDNVTSIGDFAFGGCSGLTSITIPNGVTSIGDFAFGGCSGLTSIEIPDNVTSIGNYAFGACSELENITVPKSVSYIGEAVFDGCSGLKSIIILTSDVSLHPYAIKNIAKIYCYANSTVQTYCKNNSIPFEVIGVSELRIPEGSQVQSYTKNEELVPFEMTVIWNYGNTDTVQVTSDMLTGFDTSVATGIVQTAAVNYADATATFTYTISTYKNEWMTPPSIPSWTYGQSASTPTYLARYSNENVVVEYRPASGTDADYTTAVPTNAGAYKVRLTITATAEYSALSEVIDLTIAKKSVTVTADNKTVAQFDTMPEFTYTVTGVIENNYLFTASPTASVNVENTNTHGTYTITVKGGEDTNYNFVYESGTLTVTEHTDCAYDNDCDTICNLCSGTRTVTHNFTGEWQKDADGHWRICTGCDAQELNKAAHNDDNSDGKCDICSYSMNINTPVSPNENDGLGAGAIVAIVIGSVAVAGIGGFAIFWFVIKKKSWADLITVLKKN